MQIVKQSVLATVVTLTLTASTAAGFVVWEASHNPPRVQVPHDMPSVYVPDGDVGYVLKSNLSFKSSANSTIEYYTNERGIRSSRPGEKAPIQADILVVGCSQTFGQSVPYEATFAAVIGQELGVRAVNLGVSGYGGINSLLLARRFRDLQPAILVYGFWEDHLYRNVAKCINSHAPFCLSQPFLSCQDGDSCRIVPPKNNVESMYLTQAYARDLGQGRDFYRFTDDVYWTGRLLAQRFLLQLGLADKYVQVTDPVVLRAATFAFFDLLVKETEALGVVPVVAFIPSYFDDVITGAPDYVVEASKSAGVPFLDLSEPFRREVAVHPGSLPIPGDGHMSARAHRIVAEAVVDHIVSQKLLSGARDPHKQG
jgi:hypothetical protein